MKQILIGAMMLMGFIACSDNQGAGDSQNTDSSYNAAPSTDTTTVMPDSSNVNPGAGQGTGSGAQASQDTGTGTHKQ